MNRFTVTDLPLDGLKLIERQRMGDTRGFLARLFCAAELAAAGWVKPIAQINQTYTARCGMVRGMHFQRPPHAEMKLVSCVRGEVWDVVVDIRKGSPTFLKWHAVRLSAENNLALLIPEGFAHGFQTLTDDCDLIYLHSELFHQEFEGALNIADPMIAIQWPVNITELSDRDRRHPFIDSGFRGITI